MNSPSPIAEFFATVFTADSYPRLKYIPGQTSLCMFGPVDGEGMIHWRPVRRAASQQLTSVLDQYAAMPGTAAAREFLSGYWCAVLDCQFEYEPLSLDCGAWNMKRYQQKEKDLQRRFIEQMDRNLPISVPLGQLGSGSQHSYAVKLEDGEVWLEDPYGRGVDRQAESLASFFAKLQYQPVNQDLIDKVFE